MTLISSIGEIPNLRPGDFIVINGERMRLMQATWRPMTLEECVEWPTEDLRALVVQWELEPAHHPAGTARK